MTHHYEPRPPTETRESDYIFQNQNRVFRQHNICLLYTSPSPRD